MQRPLLLSDYRILFFAVALVIYAFIGAPTADSPGFAEVVMGVLLFLGLGVSAFVQPFQLTQKRPSPLWFLAAQMLLVMGLCLPLARGVFFEYRHTDIARDLIGFLFLILPIFIVPFLQKRNAHALLTGLCLLIGVVFSLRTLFPEVIFNIRGNELLYLANSPLVLFAGIYLLGWSGQKLFETFTMRHVLIAALAVLGVIICLLAMMQDIRRATFAAVVISLLVFLMVGVMKAPLKMVFPVCVVGAVVFVFHQDIFVIMTQVSQKTAQVGLNMRVQEWEAVWQTISSDTASMILGKGWGASFASPAVGGFPVTFTHSLLSSMMLKGGLIGLLLCLFYLFFIFEKLRRLVFSSPVAAISLFWPFMISVLFYASYKSLDFGLLLTLILIWHTRDQLVRDKPKELENI